MKALLQTHTDIPSCLKFLLLDGKIASPQTMPCRQIKTTTILLQYIHWVHHLFLTTLILTIWCLYIQYGLQCSMRIVCTFDTSVEVFVHRLQPSHVVVGVRNYVHIYLLVRCHRPDGEQEKACEKHTASHHAVHAVKGVSCDFASHVR